MDRTLSKPAHSSIDAMERSLQLLRQPRAYAMGSVEISYADLARRSTQFCGLVESGERLCVDGSRCWNRCERNFPGLASSNRDAKEPS